MHTKRVREFYHILLITDDAATTQTFCDSLPSAFALTSCRSAEIRTSQQPLHRYHTIIVDWLPETLVLIPALKVRAEALRLPLGVLCSTRKAEHIAALEMGADYIEEYPPNTIHIEAHIAAYRRKHGRLVVPPRLAEPVSLPSQPEIMGPASVPHDARYAEARGDGYKGAGDGHQGRWRITKTLYVDGTTQHLVQYDQAVRLTPREYTLLQFLWKRRGQCCTRDDILDAVWKFDFDTHTNVVDYHIHALRQKLRVFGAEHLIKTLRGRGYQLILEIG